MIDRSELPQSHGERISLSDFASLRRFVTTTLCEQGQLDPRQIVLREIPLLRAGKRCGISFLFQGARSQSMQAIWAAREQQLFFYDSAGNRFLSVALGPGSVSLEDAAHE